MFARIRDGESVEKADTGAAGDELWWPWRLATWRGSEAEEAE